MARPFRLDRSNYVGLRCYFITACTLNRQKSFIDACFCASTKQVILAYAERHAFAITAYCFMPDHVHLLLRAVREDAALTRMMTAWRQRTGFAWSRLHARPLWQKGYWDHTLRTEEQILPFARYIVENPVRAGLVAHPGAYPWVGSEEYSLRDILDAAQVDLRSKWHR